jgi:putative ABC transport system permease protein
MRLGFYGTYAARSLVRGGQRTVLASLCIAVGVMAIVALQLVGLSIDAALTGNIVAANGGDLRVDTILVPLHQADLAIFDQYQQSGRITAYATTYEAPSLISLPDGRVVPFDLVVASPNFPLVGQPDFSAPSRDLRMQNVVQGSNIAVNDYVAQQLGAKIGEQFVLKTGDGQVLTVSLAAIFQDGGAFHGPQVILSRAALANVPVAGGSVPPAQYTTVMLTAPAANLNALRDELRQRFPTATVVTAQDELDLRRHDVQSIELFLRIVGLLALFIGGVGIINTMQVLLRRRRTEIAMLKAMGYVQRDLYLLFGLEAAFLGALGSLLGTALGVGAAQAVRAVVEQAFFLHLTIPLDPVTLIAAPIIGILTALIFGLLPIAQASRVRPIAVLREESARAGASWPVTFTLVGGLSLLFVGLAAAILGDLLVAVIVVYAGLAVVGVLALGFGALVSIIARLPIFERPSWRILRWLAPVALLVGACGVALVVLAHSFTSGDLIGLALSGGIPTTTKALLGAAGVLLALFGGGVTLLLAVLLAGGAMFAPRGLKTSVMLAFRNMGRQRARTTTTLSVLFVGVFAIGMIVLLGRGIEDTINTTLTTLFAHNVFVVVPPGQDAQVQTALVGAPGVQSDQTVLATVARVQPVSAGGRALATILAQTNSDGSKGIAERDTILLTLSFTEGFHLGSGNPADIPAVAVDDGRNLQASDAGTTNVVVNDLLRQPPVSLTLGATIVEQNPANGATKALVIVGFFSRPRTTDFIPGEILGDRSAIAPLGAGLGRDLFLLKADPNQIPALRQQLNQALPTAQIVTITDFSQILDRILNNLIVMLSAIASLALIAGLIIIANTVALAMVERRREIGILKSVGHTSRSVLAMVLIENGLVGFLGAAVALLLVLGVILALSVLLFQVAIVINPTLVGGIIGLTVLVTLVIAALVAWAATRVRPLEVLRYE